MNYELRTGKPGEGRYFYDIIKNEAVSFEDVLTLLNESDYTIVADDKYEDTVRTSCKGCLSYVDGKYWCSRYKERRDDIIGCWDRKIFSGLRSISDLWNEHPPDMNKIMKETTKPSVKCGRWICEHHIRYDNTCKLHRKKAKECRGYIGVRIHNIPMTEVDDIIHKTKPGILHRWNKVFGKEKHK